MSAAILESNRRRMVAILSELAFGEGLRPTRVDGVRLGRADRGYARAPVLYEPSIYIVASGRKTGYLGDRRFVYDANNYLVLSVPLPFERRPRPLSATRARRSSAASSSVSSARARPKKRGACARSSQSRRRSRFRQVTEPLRRIAASGKIEAGFGLVLAPCAQSNGTMSDTVISSPTSHPSRPAVRQARAWGATSATSPVAPMSIERREPLADDVVIEILYCGVCHSDLHQVRNEWQNSIYPIVPGHEIVGRVTKVGPAVTKFREGDLAAVGCMVDSCQHCAPCSAGLEQYCEKGNIQTYNVPDPILGGPTFGGYSESITVKESFTLKVPASLDLAATAPLLCAGITTYSPLRHWKVGPGKKVGIVGLGGLGHMGVKFARAFGAHVVLFTTSSNKVADGLRLGAHEVVVSSDAEAMVRHTSSFDFILDCVSASHDVNAYMQLLRLDGTLTLVGAPEQPLPMSAFNVILARRSFAGSGIGGIKETQEMLDFCAQHNIVSDIELIRIDQINEAYERMLKSDVRYRFVIDMQSLKG